MEQKDFICIVCPKGCNINVEWQNKKITALIGAGCPKGEAYVQAEIFYPRRVLCTSVLIRGADIPLLSVRTKEAIPKELIPAAMEIIKSVRVDAPVKIGENIISNLLGTGIDVIATKTLL